MKKLIQRLIALAIVATTLSILAPTNALATPHRNAHIYNFWDFNGATGFWNVDQHLWIGRKAPYSFWASTWAWSNSQSGGYIGLQTNGLRFDGSKGDTAIFSAWNATSASGPSCGTFGGEGTGYSCRLAYTINPGRYYRLRVWRLNADSFGQWWGGWIKDEYTGTERYIGKIRVSRSYVRMGTPRNFSEYFGSAVSCDSVPVSIVYWTQPAANHQGGGVYSYGSKADGWNRGSCTGGGVTGFDFGWTRGVRVLQGGRR
jgi:Domain of unknown function (DUF3472)